MKTYTATSTPKRTSTSTRTAAVSSKTRLRALHSALAAALVLLLSLSALAESPVSSAKRGDDGSTRRTAGWITVGAGGAALATSTVFYTIAANQHDDYAGGADKGSLDDMERSLITAKICVVTGLAAVATGLTIVLTTPSKREVQVSGGPGSVVLSGRF